MNLARVANQRVMNALADAAADPNEMAGLLMRSRAPKIPSAQTQRLLGAIRNGLLSSAAGPSMRPMPTQVVQYSPQ